MEQAAPPFAEEPASDPHPILTAKLTRLAIADPQLYERIQRPPLPGV